MINLDEITKELVASLNLKCDNYEYTQISRLLSVMPDADDVRNKLAVYKMRADFEAGTDCEYDKLTVALLPDDAIPSRFKNDIDTIDTFFNVERDFLFNCTGLSLMSLYTRPLRNGTPENAQLMYMRVAMYYADNLNELQTIYDAISTHSLTLATPIMINSYGDGARALSSCLVSAVADNVEDLTSLAGVLGRNASAGAGIAIDISNVRTRHAMYNTTSLAAGMVQMAKYYETSITVWKQNAKRKASAALYYPWYVSEIFDLLQIRNNGGVEENRARKLKYGIKLNDYFFKQLEADADVVLLDKAPEKLNYAIGNEFDALYEHLVQAIPIKDRKVVKVKDIWREILKQRVETGNLYIFFTDTVNKLSLLHDVITTSNLCCEIALPTKPGKRI